MTKSSWQASWLHQYRHRALINSDLRPTSSPKSLHNLHTSTRRCSTAKTTQNHAKTTKMTNSSIIAATRPRSTTAASSWNHNNRLPLLGVERTPLARLDKIKIVNWLSFRILTKHKVLNQLKELVVIHTGSSSRIKSTFRGSRSCRTKRNLRTRFGEANSIIAEERMPFWIRAKGKLLRWWEA